MGLEYALPYPPIHEDKAFVVLSDWDGTITTVDSNDSMIDGLGCGKERRRAIDLEILSGKVTLRDGFKEQLDSVVKNGHTFEECERVLQQSIKLDPGFKAFYQWCKSADIPVVIVSSGMAPIIRKVLSNLLGEEDAKGIDIIANDVKVESDGKWEIQFRHPASGHGHDKSEALLLYRRLPKPPILFFFGDGVSDLSAAQHADHLFVKLKGDGENDLAVHCAREGIDHLLFSDFSKALPLVQAIVEQKKD